MRFSETDENLLKKAIEQNDTYTSILKSLNIVCNSNNINKLKEFIKTHNINFTSSKDYQETPLSKVDKITLSNIVQNANTFKEVLLQLGYINPCSGSYLTLKNKIKQWNIDISHMTHCNKNQKRTRVREDQLFSINSPHTHSTIRAHFIKYNKIEYKCVYCGNTGEWLGKPLTLTLDHINGNRNDNRLENLQFVCPNCDRQQDTFGSKNKHRYYNFPRQKTVYTCSVCGKTILSADAKYCDACRLIKTRKVIHPSKEQLIEDILNLPMIHIGKKYGVTDTAIKKWLKKYDLPFTYHEIKVFRESQGK